MLLICDTEFTGSDSLQLISIALVSEDGAHEIYFERTDLDEADCSDFVIENVLPLLHAPPADRLPYSQIGDRLHGFFGKLP